MKNLRSALAAGILALATAISAQIQAQAPAVDLTPVNPESLGFSAQRLDRLHKLIQDEVDQKQLAGAITLVARHGKVADLHIYGQRNMEAAAPMTQDTIFRAYSMSKPITGVAMMILYEEGKWLPSDPISKYIPEFANLKVYTGTTGDGGMILADPVHAPTIGELMSHTAGFSYDWSAVPAVAALYRDKKPTQSKNLQEMIDKLATIPLNYQPGQGWRYSVSMDIEGYLVEKLSGQSLPDFMHDRIFAPLGMNDTGFYVPADKRSRFATNYTWHNDTKQLIANPTENGIPTDYTAQPTFASGGGGLVSTLEDYYRFALMLSRGGALGNARGETRILAPSTVKLMTSNHLSDSVIHGVNGQWGIGLSQMRPGFGYGYNVAVVYDPPEANLTDGKGTFFWDGAAGTWFWVDPTNDVVFVGMIQRMTSPDNHPLEYKAQVAVNQALVDPAK